MGWRTALAAHTPSLTRYAVLVGTCMLTLPIGMPWFYGNLSTYVDSFFISCLGKENHNTGSLWVLAMFVGSVTVSLFLSGFIAGKIGAWCTMLIGLVGFNASMSLTYFTCLHSFWLMNLSLGASAGLFAGLIYSMAMLYAALWFPDSPGLAIAIAISGFGGGGLILNPIITTFINPEDKVPDIVAGNSRYFSQEDILWRVPFVFLLLGGISALAHVIGVLLLKDPPMPSQDSNTKYSKIAQMQDDEETSTETTTLKSSSDNCSENSDQEWPEVSEKNRKSGNRARDYSTVEMLKTPTFYILFSTYILFEYGFEVEANSYKQFGIKHINDDYFMSIVGILINATVLCSRVVWGFIVDKTEFKLCFLIILGLNAMATVFWYFTALVDRWLYLFWTLLVNALQSGVLIIYPVMTLTIFGQTNYATNYGIVVIGGAPLGFVAPFCVDLILHKYGYFAAFFSVSVAFCASMGLALLLPRGHLS